MSVVRTEDRGAVRHVVLQPPREAQRDERRAGLALGSALEEAAADESVRCVVVRGEGAMFSSGMDLGDLKTLSDEPEKLRSFRRPILNYWNLLEEMPKPTICRSTARAWAGRSSWRSPRTSASWPRRPSPGSWR